MADDKVKKNSLPIIGFIITGAIAVAGWSFGGVQSANAQTHNALESRMGNVEKSIGLISIERAEDRVTLETIREDVKEIRDILKGNR